MKHITSLVLVLGIIVVPQAAFGQVCPAGETPATRPGCTLADTTDTSVATPGSNASQKGWTTGLSNGTTGGVSQLTPTAIIKNIINYALAIVGFLGVLGFIISGIMYLVSAGDEKSAEKAKGYMVNSIIGVIVALLGYVVMAAISTLLVGGNSSNL